MDFHAELARQLQRREFAVSTRYPDLPAVAKTMPELSTLTTGIYGAPGVWSAAQVQGLVRSVLEARNGGYPDSLYLLRTVILIFLRDTISSDTVAASVLERIPHHPPEAFALEYLIIHELIYWFQLRVDDMLHYTRFDFTQEEEEDQEEWMRMVDHATRIVSNAAVITRRLYVSLSTPLLAAPPDQPSAFDRILGRGENPLNPVNVQGLTVGNWREIEGVVPLLADNLEAAWSFVLEAMLGPSGIVSQEAALRYQELQRPVTAVCSLHTREKLLEYILLLVNHLGNVELCQWIQDYASMAYYQVDLEGPCEQLDAAELREVAVEIARQLPAPTLCGIIRRFGTPVEFEVDGFDADEF